MSIAQNKKQTLDLRLDSLNIEGLSHHNFKNQDLSIPHDKLVVICGLSGSGKSTLAFDTIYAEGGRRYIETFSPYTRQFLDRLPRPELKKIENVRPSLALEQRNRISSSRSTVGTTTEINDYLKVLWPNVSELHCPSCREVVQDYSKKEVFSWVISNLGNKEGNILPTFKVELSKKVSLAMLKETLQADGFLRLFDRKSAQVLRLDDYNPKTKPSHIEVLVDRISTSGTSLQEEAEELERLNSSLTQAMTFGRGEYQLYVLIEDKIIADRAFSEERCCKKCDLTFSRITSSSFSFNSAIGACKKCTGFGKVLEFDLDKVILDPSLSISEGVISFWNTPSTTKLKAKLKAFCEDEGISISTSWNKLKEPDKKSIIFGSAGKKRTYPGIKGWFDSLAEKKHKMHIRIFVSRYRSEVLCPDCSGSRLMPDALNYKVKGKSIFEIWNLSVSDLLAFFKELKINFPDRSPVATAHREILQRLGFLESVGLSYLTLDRQTKTLSGGEFQRVNLTTLLGTNLVASTFVLDEPTIGLHPRDTERLIDSVRLLQKIGNTVVLVEHDPDVILAADHVIEIGPGAGSAGGEVVFQGSVKELLKAKTKTGEFLRNRDLGELKNRKEFKIKKFYSIENARANNLKNIDAQFPVGAFSVLTGVSGSGKSSLISNCLSKLIEDRDSYPAVIKGSLSSLKGFDNFKKVVSLDQSPIGRSSRANPATYTKAWDIIREYLADTDDAKAQGLTKSSFSFNVDGGRCPVCQGQGSLKIEMQFLSDVSVPCESCSQRRFQDHVLAVSLGGKNVNDILLMSISDFMEFLNDLPDEGKNQKIKKLLNPLIQLGMGYLSMGHSLSTLSGGEAQRLKLASYIGAGTGSSLIILDEPTTGLHPEDIKELLKCIRLLTDQGNSVLCIEHNLDLIRSADWFVELGPDGGSGGGQLLVEGLLSELIQDKSKNSDTLSYLRDSKRNLVNLSEIREKKSSQNKAVSKDSDIQIVGAREHNLKDINLNIPRNKLLVFTGVSGSGKSSLAFDILYSEGQRRFIDCLSPYARQYMNQESRPEVDAVMNIPPTIAVSQKTAPPMGVSTLATVTEVYQFLRLLYAKAGDQYCPRDGTLISNFSNEALVEECLERYKGKKIFIFAPVVSGRKGHYNDLFKRAIEADIRDALIDGSFKSFTEETKLERHKLHTISLLIGSMQIGPKSKDMLSVAIGQATVMGGGSLEIVEGDPRNQPEIFSASRMCPKCKQGFLALDPQDFSFRSKRGMCSTCEGWGKVKGTKGSGYKVCPTCSGGRIRKLGASVLFGGEPIYGLSKMKPDELKAFLSKLEIPKSKLPIVSPIFEELLPILDLINEIGLSYLSLDRDASTLSGGEAQRLRLAKNIGAPLTGVCYVLDEPSIGLHPKNHRQLMRMLEVLRDQGNSVIIVEHDEDTILDSDYIIDIGPTGGSGGGNLVYQGDLQGLLKCKTSITGECLRKRAKDRGGKLLVQGGSNSFEQGYISLKSANANNLKNIDVRIPVGSFSAVVGVSGAGKSSLVHSSLVPAIFKEFEGLEPEGVQTWESVSGLEEIQRLIEIDQSPIGRTPASTPASFLGIMNHIRDLFAELPDAKIRGWNSSFFSYNTGKGRCETCQGKGYTKVPLSFLPDAVSICEDCNALRYSREALDIKYQGKSLGDILKMTISEAAELFVAHKKIKRALNYANEIGIGYIQLGQASHTLSGGEAQRLKIVKELSLREASKTLYILDEPSIGLHMADVDKLSALLKKLVAGGNTVLIIEHNLDLISAADYVIDIGPGPAENGGEVLYQGSSYDYFNSKFLTPTKEAIEEYLQREI